MTEQENSKLLKLIQKGDVKTALENLLSLEIHDSIRNEAILLSSRYNKFKKEHRLGILSFEQSNITENQIKAHLVDLINHPDDQPFSIKKSIDITNPTKPIVWKYITAAAVILGILGSLAEVLNIISIFPSNQAHEKLQLTVFVTDTKGNVVLENEGRLNIPLGNRSLNEVIGASGRTNFPDITADNMGDTILIGLDAPGWEIADGRNIFVFTGEPIHLKVKKDDSLGILKGVVKSKDGQKFIEGALVQINADTFVVTNSLGVFKIILPEEMRIKNTADRYLLTVSKEDYVTRQEYYSPKSSDADIRLIKK